MILVVPGFVSRELLEPVKKESDWPLPSQVLKSKSDIHPDTHDRSHKLRRRLSARSRR